MKDLLKPLLPRWIINNFYHLPKAILANMFYDFPTRGLKVIGVTGTDGKTTTVNMIYQIIKEAGKKVSMVSTINAVVGGKTYDTGFHVTSPDPFMIQKFAKEAKNHGDQFLVLEVTSHALDQYRFWGIKFDVGVVTNITHEHLDYHNTFENYKNTKLKLIKDAKFAIINEEIGKIESIKGEIITFGLDRGDFNQKQIKLKLKLIGNYNIENALAALALAYVLDIPKNLAQKKLEEFDSLTGRMEEIKNNKGIKVMIDFAHTPNALENALKALRSTNSGKIIAVFGCAGKRDIAKRPLMGAISARLADVTIITAEDPRGELDKINQQIVEGAKKAGAKMDVNLFIIKDRQKAIEFAIQNAKRGDVVGIFGKGHEASMNLDGRVEIPWSDKEAVRKAFNGS